MTTITNDQRSTVTGTGGLFQCGLGLDLVVTSNAITITDSVHFVGGTGALTTINFGTVSAPSTPATVYLISSTGATWTFGYGGNVQGPYPTVANGTVFLCVWDGTTWHVAYTQDSITPTMFGAVGDGVTDDAAAFQAAIDLAGQTKVAVSAPPTPNGYFLKSPLVIKKNFSGIIGTPRMKTSLTFDLTTYTGPHLKYGIIIGDDTVTPSAGTTYQSNILCDLNINVRGGTGGVLLQRATLTTLDQVNVDGGDAALSYGIRSIASDSMVTMQKCSIGGSGPTNAPNIGISIENGSNQNYIEDCVVLAKTVPIQHFNCLGTWICRNTIGAYVSASGSFYGIKILTDQAVPSWLTWIAAGASDVQILNNWFEPSEHAGAIVYDIYVGNGTPALHAVIGCVLQDNFFFGTTLNVRYPIYIDYADQTIVRGARWFGTIQDLVHVTANSNHAVIDIPELSTYNQTPVVGTLINVHDSATRTQIVGRFVTPTFNAGVFTAAGGGNAWTVQADSVDNFQYSIYAKRMLVNAYLLSTDVAGTPTTLQVTIPGGYVAAKEARTLAYVVDNSTVAANSVVTALGTHLLIQRGDGGAFTATTGGTSVQFQIELEVV